MTKSETTSEETTTKENRKREVTAAITSGAVAIVLGIATQVLVGKVAGVVHDRIAKKNENENK